jgi:tRNA G18 (ribose-2'-O)-methylase SpoU
MLIYGINAVAEALRAGRVVSLRAGPRKDHRLQELLALAGQASVPVRRIRASWPMSPIVSRWGSTI